MKLARVRREPVDHPPCGGSLDGGREWDGRSKPRSSSLTRANARRRSPSPRPPGNGGERVRTGGQGARGGRGDLPPGPWPRGAADDAKALATCLRGRHPFHPVIGSQWSSPRWTPHLARSAAWSPRRACLRLDLFRGHHEHLRLILGHPPTGPGSWTNQVCSMLDQTDLPNILETAGLAPSRRCCRSRW